MRHFSLLRFLAFSTSSDCVQSSHVALHRHSTKADLSPMMDASPLPVRKLRSALSSNDMQESSPTKSAGRREFFAVAATGTLAFLTPSPRTAHALDVEAFANSQLESDTKNCNPKTDSKCLPQLTPDQAMCQYGQTGKARAAACQRIREAGGELPAQRPGGSSPGGAYAL